MREISKNTLDLLKASQSESFEAMARVLAILAAPVRLKLVHFLSQAPLTVEVLSQKTDQSVANTSMHLRKMLQEKIVTTKTIGQKRLYSLHPAMLEFWEVMQDFLQTVQPEAEFHPEEVIEDYAWKLDWPQTQKLLEKKEVILLDVRPADEVLEPLEYALHIPSAELKKSLSQLPKKKKVLVFCRGRLCALSAMSVQLLRDHGIEAYRLDKSWFVLQQFLKETL